MFAKFSDSAIPRLKGTYTKIKNDKGGKTLLIPSVVIVLLIFSIQIHFFPEWRFIIIFFHEALVKPSENK